MTNVRFCFCGNQHPFEKCCEPLILGERRAENAEQLMRSRFSAFMVHNGQYLFDTHHRDFRQSLTPELLTKSASETEWIRLEVLSFLQHNDKQANVHFRAWYIDQQRLDYLEEKSEFVFDEQWFYTTGQHVQSDAALVGKIQRNDPCPCHSGKKFKKCHG